MRSKNAKGSCGLSIDINLSHNRNNAPLTFRVTINLRGTNDRNAKNRSRGGDRRLGRRTGISGIPSGGGRADRRNRRSDQTAAGGRFEKFKEEYQTQIRGLQKQLDGLKAPRSAPPPPPAAVAAKCRIFGTGTDVGMANTFIEAASISRTCNETADIAAVTTVTAVIVIRRKRIADPSASRSLCRQLIGRFCSIMAI